MYKNISKLLKIKNGDIISITGCGGKTTLMNKLAKELRNKGRVLICTSTKIKRPTNKEADFIYDSFTDYEKVKDKNIIVAIGKLLPQKNKLSSITEHDINSIKKDFNYIIIEADGCRNLPLKMWKSHEPVIYNISNKNIAVFSAKTIDRKIEEDFIYNYAEFKKVIEDRFVNEDVFLKLINSNPGPFKNFNKEKFVFFNQVETKNERTRVREVISYLKNNTEGIKYISGSLLEEEYYED
ncbi:putative selenium-dependent hydroxylase accessory protein YqeC [Peptoniphilus olsenii]|uniref:Selenium-dependent hydroxylase accessory protein YqeC n=1 Tax=Peptoniphilus olsenii TaxID=411570 RepID=A0ABV2JBM2_9FIRM